MNLPYSKYRFYLSTYLEGEQYQSLEVEPVEWNEFGISIDRNETFHAPDIEPSLKKITLHSGGYNAIRSIYNQKGVNSEAFLRVEKRYVNGLEIGYEQIGNYQLDFSSLEFKTTAGEGEVVEMEMSENSNKIKLRSRRNQSLPYGGKLSVENKELAGKAFEAVKIKARELMLSANFSIEPFDFVSDEGTSGGRLAVPFIINGSNITEAQSIINPRGSFEDKSVFTYAGRNTVLNIKGEFDVRHLINGEETENNVPLYMSIYDSDLNLVSEERLSLDAPFSIDRQVTLNQGEMLSLHTSYFSNPNRNNRIEGEGYLTITAEADYEDSFADVAMVYELADSLLQQILDTDKSVLISRALGRTDLGYGNDGSHSLFGVTSGLLLRNAKKQDGTKPDLVTQFFDLFEALDRYKPLCLFHKNGNIHIENRIESYSNNSTQINVTDLTIQVGEYFTKIKAGSPNQEYLSTDGLLEYNIEREFTTPARVKEKLLDLTIPYQTDYTGVELARRIQFSTDDSSYDDKLFLLSLERAENGFQTKLGNYDVIEGINSPETAGNLDLTPKRQVHNSWARNSWYKNENVKGISTNSENISNLATTKDGIKVEENSNLDIRYSVIPPYLPENFKINGTISRDNLTNFDHMGRLDFVWNGVHYSGFVKNLEINDGKIQGELQRAR